MKQNLSNFYLSIQLYKRQQNGNFTWKRLTTLTKSQRINNPQTVNQRRGNLNHNNKRTRINKHCSIITLIINGLNFPQKDTD